jgi:predicted NBD/HSP70 family sugar kinase
MGQNLWGIDLGGTKIEGVILNSLSDQTPLVRTRIDTEASKGYKHIISQITRLVNELADKSGLKPETIGIGTPGVLDPQLQTMKNCNTTCLNGMPLKQHMEEELQMPLHFANDANCFALAETQFGVVKSQCPDASVVFGIIMGTGVGGGIVINGKIWGGHHGIGGEWGHNFLDESGGPCYCGKSGCVETILSGPALERYYKSISGKTLSLKQIVSSETRSADDAANKTTERLCHYFGKGVASIINLLDPDVIIVGGGVGNIDAIYSEGISALKHFIFNNRLTVPVLRPTLGDSAGVFGAAALVA